MEEVTLAWIKGKRTNGLRRVVVKQSTFAMPNINRTIKYDADLKLETDEWFCYENFSQSEFAIDILNKEEAALAASTLISEEEFQHVKFLVHYATKGIFMFQTIMKSRILQVRSITFIKKAPEIVDNQYMIILQDSPDAIYNKNEDKLYFKDLSRISNIFSGISKLYREATDEEVKNFLQSEYLNVSDEFDYTKVSVPSRKKIALFGTIYMRLDDDQKTEFKNYLLQYKPEFKIEEDKNKYKFGISNDDDISGLLCACAERYYTTPFSKNPMLARSVQKI